MIYLPNFCNDLSKPSKKANCPYQATKISTFTKHLIPQKWVNVYNTHFLKPTSNTPIKGSYNVCSQFFFPKDGLPPSQDGIYKGAKQKPLNGSNFNQVLSKQQTFFLITYFFDHFLVWNKSKTVLVRSTNFLMLA